MAISYRGRTPGRRAITRVRHVYNISFPAWQRVSFEQLLLSVKAGRRTLWVDHSINAFGVTLPLRRVESVNLLEYLAVHPDHRSLGLGGKLLDDIVNDAINARLILEVEGPACEGARHSDRRIAFYERHGGRAVECARGYAMPNLSEEGIPRRFRCFCMKSHRMEPVHCKGMNCAASLRASGSRATDSLPTTLESFPYRQTHMLVKGAALDLSGWAAVGTVVAAGANVGTLAAVAWQLRSLARQTRESARQAEASAEAIRASVNLTVSKTMIEMDMFFLERPELRGHIYGHTDGDGGNDLESHQARAAAEMFIDFVKCVITHEKYMAGEVAVGWKTYFEELMLGSEALQDFWYRNRHWYEPDMQELLDPALALARSRREKAVEAVSEDAH